MKMNINKILTVSYEGRISVSVETVRFVKSQIQILKKKSGRGQIEHSLRIQSCLKRPK